MKLPNRLTYAPFLLAGLIMACGHVDEVSERTSFLSPPRTAQYNASSGDLNVEVFINFVTNADAFAANASAADAIVVRFLSQSCRHSASFVPGLYPPTLAGSITTETNMVP